MSGAPMPPTGVKSIDIDAVLALFTEEELAAARRLAKADRNRWDVIGRDPTGAGWKFIRRALIVLRERDPGELFRLSKFAELVS